MQKPGLRLLINHCFDDRLEHNFGAARAWLARAAIRHFTDPAASRGDTLRFEVVIWPVQSGSFCNSVPTLMLRVDLLLSPSEI